ncbi:hypothetical protein [Amycolatopsis azurea]|uniref:Uncharacterized protein n=1 Tax=Amycolatopsis azurea DSM 43854 TaxID=1238180 RepID=M2Q2Y3_9PSEU|nr:hypothetical protein [Amycolatopsis azurea]EMD26320.1 hypothetical protein C791_3622 [Amycolatopsis azurea DSM 43854]OOC07742.1 hypothetical protein B0293_06315 [Amycolatopsis azurea DSM 43854]
MPDRINADTESMSAYSSKLTAPEMPPSLARLGTPPNLTGLFEGIAMSVLDKAATASVAAFMAKMTEEMVTDSAKVKAAALTYSAADVTSALELATSATKVLKQGIDLVKKTAGSGQQQPSTTEKPADQPVGDAPQDLV